MNYICFSGQIYFVENEYKHTLSNMLNYKSVDGTVDVSGGNDSSDREQKLEMHPLSAGCKRR